jgi:hypothetical protein
MQAKQKKILVTGLVVLLAAVVAGLIVWDTPRNEIEFLLEKSSIEKVARAYLQAEKERNLEQVYAQLAPSSTYKKSSSYHDYLQDAGSSPIRIQSYRIVDIYRFRDNDNRENYPAVEKLVQVEVEITFAHTGENSIYNYCFTFLKEKGTWYKG